MNGVINKFSWFIGKVVKMVFKIIANALTIKTLTLKICYSQPIHMNTNFLQEVNNHNYQLQRRPLECHRTVEL